MRKRVRCPRRTNLQRLITRGMCGFARWREVLILAWIYRQPVEIIFKAGGIHNIGKIIEENAGNRGVLIHSSFFSPAVKLSKTF